MIKKLLGREGTACMVLSSSPGVQEMGKSFTLPPATESVPGGLLNGKYKTRNETRECLSHEFQVSGSVVRGRKKWEGTGVLDRLRQSPFGNELWSSSEWSCNCQG